MIKVCFKTKFSNDKWYLDSAYSRHMARNRAMFATLQSKDGGYVTFGDNSKEKSLVYVVLVKIHFQL
ncbi:unnamed protein product [Camellia sinensis]